MIKILDFTSEKTQKKTNNQCTIMSLKSDKWLRVLVAWPATTLAGLNVQLFGLIQKLESVASLGRR